MPAKSRYKLRPPLGPPPKRIPMPTDPKLLRRHDSLRRSIAYQMRKQGWPNRAAWILASDDALCQLSRELPKAGRSKGR